MGTLDATGLEAQGTSMINLNMMIVLLLTWRIISGGLESQTIPETPKTAWFCMGQSIAYTTLIVPAFVVSSAKYLDLKFLGFSRLHYQVKPEGFVGYFCIKSV